MPDSTIPADAEAAATIGAAWNDLLAAARQAGYAVGEMIRVPATDDQLAAAERGVGRRLPEQLSILYRLSDGQTDYTHLYREPSRSRRRELGRWLGPLFGGGWDFRTLRQLENDYRSWADLREQYTPEELAEEFDDVIEVRGSDPVKRRYTCADWIPFATDGGGNSLAVDLAPEPGGAVGQVIVIGSDEDMRRVVAPSVLDLLRLCADRLRHPLDDLFVEDGMALYSLEHTSAD